MRDTTDTTSPKYVLPEERIVTFDQDGTLWVEHPVADEFIDRSFFRGYTYLFSHEMKANVLLNPAFPQREGTNVTGQKDVKGKLFHQAIIDTAETKGSGWVDYWFSEARTNRAFA